MVMLTGLNIQIHAALLAQSLAILAANRLDRNLHRHIFINERKKIDIPIFGKKIIGVCVLAQVRERKKLVELRRKPTDERRQAADTVKHRIARTLHINQNPLLDTVQPNCPDKIIEMKIVIDVEFLRLYIKFPERPDRLIQEKTNVDSE